MLVVESRPDSGISRPIGRKLREMTARPRGLEPLVWVSPGRMFIIPRASATGTCEVKNGLGSK